MVEGRVEGSMPSMHRLALRHWSLALLLVLLALGGGSKESEAPVSGTGTPIKTCPKGTVPPVDGQCEAGVWLREDGCCQPAGLPPDMPCPPGEYELAGYGCVPAGLPPDMPCPPGE